MRVEIFGKKKYYGERYKYVVNIVELFIYNWLYVRMLVSLAIFKIEHTYRSRICNNS